MDEVEALARAYCREMGIDPDEDMPVIAPTLVTMTLVSGDPFTVEIPGPEHLSPRWRTFEKDAQERIEATRFAERQAERERQREMEKAAWSRAMEAVNEKSPRR